MILLIYPNKFTKNLRSMAQIIKASGETIEVNPSNGKHFSLKEMQDVVGGYIEVVSSYDGKKRIVLNDEGKLNKLPINEKATELYNGNTRILHDVIVGDVLVIAPSQIN